MNLVWDTVFTNEYCMDTASTGSIEVQHSLGGGGGGGGGGWVMLFTSK